MSLSKRLCLSSDSLKRQSFSERICDDLSEVILQYLELEDKLKLESVSKQFQRTVLRKQYELIIISDGSALYKRIEESLFKNNSFDLKALESLLKKCPNITSIEIFYQTWDNSSSNFISTCHNYNEFIALITKYCDNLDNLKFPIDKSVCAFNEFHNKFGSKLMSININIEFENNLDLLKKFTCIKVLEVNADICMQEFVNSLSGAELNKIESLSIHSGYRDEEPAEYEDRILSKCLLDHFKHVRKLDLDFGWRFGDEEFAFYPIELLNTFSKLKNLIALKLDGYILDIKMFYKSFKQMADNCPKLKSIELNFDIYEIDSGRKMKRLLSQFLPLKQLKRLKVGVSIIHWYDEDYNQEEEDEEDEDTEIFSFEAFEKYSELNITHFSMVFYETECSEDIESFKKNFRLDENFLTDIDINLPNIQYLELPYVLNITSEEVTKVADILSRLSKLESIRLETNESSTDEQLSKEVALKCKKIRNIDIMKHW